MRYKLLILLTAVIFIFTGCSQQDYSQDSRNSDTVESESSSSSTGEETLPPEKEALPSDVLSPSQIDGSLADTYVKVKGKITLFHQDDGGVALWLSDGKGKVGIRIESDDWEGFSAEEQAQYKTGNTIIGEGMLVLTPTQELFVVLGTAPPSEGRPLPKFAAVDIIAGPVNLSRQPAGSRGWPNPQIFIRGDKLVVTYWGEVNGRLGNWLIESDDGTNWSNPRQLPGAGQILMNDDSAYFISCYEHTGYENQGSIGAVINVMDDDYSLVEKIVVDTRTCLNSIDRSTFPQGALDDRGNVHITWAADTEIGTDVFYAMYDGESLTETVSVSKNPDMGSLCQNIAADENGTVYISWAESLEPWNPVTEGGYPDVFYAYMENGRWSEPIDASNTPDWGEYGMGIYPNSEDIHAFYGSSKETEPGHMYYLQIRKNEILRREIANFSFTDIDLVFDGDEIHGVYGGWIYASDYSGTDVDLVMIGTVYYNYFDGKDWYAGMGADLLPEEFAENSEKPILVPESIGPGVQDQIILEDGGTDTYREIHPEAVCKDGLIYAVFEHNQHGTFDVYYVILRPNNP